MALLRSSRHWLLFLWALTVCSLFNGAQPTQAARPALRMAQRPPSAAANGLTGWFSLLWVDPPSGETSLPGPITELTDDRGRTYRLVIPADLAQKLGGVQSLDQHRVSVSGSWIDARAGVVRVADLQMSAAGPLPTDENLQAADASATVTKPYALILCRFSDTTSFTPHDKSYYEGLVGDVYPGASHFWNQSSFGAVRFTGSVAFGWYNLPRPASFYMRTDGSNLMDTTKLFNDATVVADADIDYRSFVGIEVFVNFNLGNAAYGSAGRTATLDGQTRIWTAAWLPLWGHVPSVVCHEMGHTLGLLHSSGPYQATYDSRWDVMSGGQNSRSPDPTYGATPVDTIAWHKARLGWIPAKRRYIAQPGSRQTIQLTRVALPVSSEDYLMAQIFISGWSSRFYTVELRQFAGYDSVGGLPGEGVVIHKVDITLFDRLAQVVDPDGNGNPNDAGAIWTPGETFTDTANGVTIAIDGTTPTGMRVTISVNSDVPLPEVVSNTGDQGPGSLRNAILFANQFPETAIQFSVPQSDPGFAGGVFTLQPTVSLPAITGSGIVIDGGSQLARTGDTNGGRPPLVLNGSRAGAVAIGLQIVGEGCLIRRLTVNGFAGYGIQISGAAAAGNRVEGCFVGLNATGTAALPNGVTGIEVDWGATNNVIGGTTPEARNVISGNTGYALVFFGVGTDRNVAQGNFIGTDVTGRVPLANGTFAVIAFGGAKGNTIGGTLPAAANVISGNKGYALVFYGAGTDANVVQGNRIGTDPTGRVAVPNASYGVLVYGGAKGSIIGGSAAGAGNLISGNGGHGISVQGDGTSGTAVRGNFVGTDLTGMVALPNGGNGVDLNFGAQNNLIGGSATGARNLIGGNRGHGVSIFNAGTRGNLVQGNAIGTDATGRLRLGNFGFGVVIGGGASRNTIGGSISAEGNQIAFNAGAGIHVQDAASVGNTLRANAIHHSAGLGINLSGGSQDSYGVTANDSGDADTGPNNLQNYPVIEDVTAANGETIISGSINSSGGATFALDFYANTEVSASGFGEGAVHLGAASVSTGATGAATFVFRVPAALADQFITATATNVTTGDTSEFSQARRGS
jgi:hypothetical protein